MELKVLMDGVQRIISGVTLDTTCKDIVLCLAQATRQFGKFILIEKWQNNERLLNPNDNPIRVLTQWGEYSNDIIFIMKRCDSSLDEAIVKSPKTSFQSDSFYSRNGENFCLKDTIKSPQLISESTTNGSNLNTGLFNKESEDEVKSASSQSKVISNIQNKNNNSIMRRPKKPPPYYEAIAKSALVNSGSTKTSQNLIDPNTTNNNDCFRVNNNSLNSKLILDSQIQDQSQAMFSNKLKQNDEASYKLKNSQNSEIKHRDALKLINLQKNTMNTQNRELLELDSEINFWDNKFRRNEELRHQLELETHHLEQVLNEQESQIKDLESQNLDKEMEIFEKESQKIETAKNNLRYQLNEMESKIASCHQSIQSLTEEINLLKIQKEDERLNQQLTESKLELKKKIEDYEKQSEELRLINEEIYGSDEIIKNKFKEIESILQELKEENITGLSLLPRDSLFTQSCSDFKLQTNSTLDEEINISRSFIKPNRPGSTRRMFYGSPRELRNAVATCKNPHGVWV